MHISEHGAFALSMATALSRVEKPAFDRSKVFMVCMLNFDEFRRLHVVMQGGHSFDIDSHQVPFNLDIAADWLVGDI
ncbi:hypothetical protein [Pseudomonas grimontii]|uniref:hypothetical protein n=1 Tax=Pseudomonas grimontii TaxID=129847 RepID=UPI00387B8F88